MTLVLPDGYQYVAGSLLSAAWVIIWQILRINPARGAAAIPYPQLYAENAQLKDNPAALRYNCVQRCHQNTLESIPLILISTLITGLKYPYIAAAASFFWVLTRVAYTIGYSSGVPQKRALGAVSGSLTLMALLVAATVTTVQVCFFLGGMQDEALLHILQIPSSHLLVNPNWLSCLRLYPKVITETTTMLCHNHVVARGLSHGVLYFSNFKDEIKHLAANHRVPPRQARSAAAEPYSSASSGIAVMVKYCGYLVGDASLYQRALDIGYPPATSPADVNQTVIMATRHIRTETGVYAYTKLRRVNTNKGKRCWCIAFASDAFWEHLLTSAPSEEKYRLLKEELKKDGPPRWYLAD